jgi:putative ABC transport system substrate-binding protein
MQFDQSRRSEFITLLGGAATWPLKAHAQQPEIKRRIGVLMPITADDPEAPLRVEAFAQGLQQFGWIDGRNVQIDYRWAGGKGDDARKYAAELIALAPDVIFALAASASLPLFSLWRPRSASS